MTQMLSLSQVKHIRTLSAGLTRCGTEQRVTGRDLAGFQRP